MTSKVLSGLAIAAIASTGFAGAALAQDGGDRHRQRRQRRRLDRERQRRPGFDRLDQYRRHAAAASVSAAIDAAIATGDDIAAAVIAAIYGG